MSWFNNLKIKAKMISGFFTVIVLMVLLSVISIIQLKDVASTYRIVIDNVVECRQAILHYQSNFFDLRRMIATLSTYTEYDLDRCEEIINESVALYDTSFKYLDMYNEKVETNAALSDSEKQLRFDKSHDIRLITEKYHNEFMLLMFDAARNDDHKLSLLILDKSVALTDDIGTLVQELINISNDAVITQTDHANIIEYTTIVLLIVISAGAAILAVIIALFIATRISRPLLSLSAFMKKAGSTGDISLSSQDIDVLGKSAKAKDEIGQTIANTTTFVQHVNQIAGELEHVANGDLTICMDTLSNADTMGQALKLMVESLNKMFTEIYSSASYVANNAALVDESAKQIACTTTNIAEGAQQLAQGSTDQAASVQELSGVINIIEEKTRENAHIADEAALLADNVIGNAQKGNHQMEEMISAVKDIAEANQSIQSIMNTINDIATQTNLLSLNAAIEAARAGEHGKGFAVVADEVRNLAAQSAEAAQQTSSIIEVSIEKSQLGSNIVDKTAESFKEIVNGLTESSKLIKSIAKASQEQAAGISKVKIGIDQVSDIVEQNSATAQESAAASQESSAAATESINAADNMKTQAQTLKNLVSQFKLA